MYHLELLLSVYMTRLQNTYMCRIYRDILHNKQFKIALIYLSPNLKYYWTVAFVHAIQKITANYGSVSKTVVSSAPIKAIHNFLKIQYAQDKNIWAVSRKKGPNGIFYQIIDYYIFWMYIILRLISEMLSTIASKRSFLWRRQDFVCVICSKCTSWYLRNGMQQFTSVILYMNIIFSLSVRLWCAHFEILQCCRALARRHNLFKPESNFKKARVDLLPR